MQSNNSITNHFLVFYIVIFLFGTCQARWLLEDDFDDFKNNTSPLFAFGQNIIREKALWIYPGYFRTETKRSTLNSYVGQIIYGISDNIEVSAFPTYSTGIIDGKRIKGFEDLLVQGEFALHQHGNAKKYSLISLVTGIYLPISKGDLDIGKTHYFLGTTFVYITNEWYLYTEVGGIPPVKKQGRKIGHIIDYQAGVGRALTSSENYFISLMGEFQGLYVNSDFINNQIDPDTGRHIHLAGPVLQVGFGGNLNCQLGVLYPFHQSFKGNQSKLRYIMGASIYYFHEF